jgi:hypothetical protein
MKETQKHKDAFEHFYIKLNEGMSVTDSILSVAEKFKVTSRTAWRWYKKLDWEAKRTVRDADIQTGVEEKTNTTIIDNKAKYLGIVHFSLNKYVEDVNSKKIEPIEIRDSKDLDRLIKLGLLIQNQPTDIQEQTGSIHVKLDERRERLKRIEAKYDDSSGTNTSGDTKKVISDTPEETEDRQSG